MRECDAFRRLVSPFLDGELVGEDRAAFSEHVAGCAACGASLAEERRIVELVRSGVPLYQAPAGLRQGVERLLGRARPARSISRWAVAAACLGAALLAVGAQLLQKPAAATEARAPSELAALAVRTHLAYTRGELPLDIRTAEAREVSRFFAGRVPFQLTLPDYRVAPGERKPYELAGGRLISFKSDSAAFVAYRMERRPISLLVTSASAVQPAGGEVVRSANLRFHVESVGGLKVITWMDNGLTYALASDLDAPASQSCLVCHGSPQEHRKLEPLARTRS